jgi:diguanylate cyclase (GGDEF)-like protein
MPRSLKRAARLGAGPLAAVAACAALAAGGLASSARVPPAADVALVACIGVLVLVSLTERLRFAEPSARAQRVSFWLRAAPGLIDAQLGLALVAGAFAAAAVTGAIASPLYPLVYGVIAFAVSFLSRAAAWSAVVAALALELAQVCRVPADDRDWVAAALHLAFIAAAAVAHAAFLRGLIARQRRLHRERLAAEVRHLRDEARDFRLISAALSADSRAPRPRGEEEKKLAEGAVETLRASIYYTLGLVKRSLEARTCALLWLDPTGEALKIKELVSDSDAVTERRVIALAGAPRAVVRDGRVIAVPSVKASQLPYYELDEQVGAFLGVPVFEGQHLRGVLCADRARPFDDRDTSVLEGATEQLVRAIQSEQVFTAVERSKYELERFFRASDMLCRALTLDEVMDTAFDAAAQIVDVDLAAISLYERERRRHRVCKVRVAPDSPMVADVDAIAGLEFRENTGLASMAVKNKHYLPAAGTPRDQSAPIYTKRVRLKNVESLLVLPLLCADEAIGTFTLASRRPNRFGHEIREMLGIIANQVAVSLQNAMMYKKMETMATTDGLTGLTNHRTFQDRCATLLERAARHGHKAAVLLTDVDHFKKVNDNYGHPVGDEVLRRVARVLIDVARKIDITARYGGEEFVVVLEATDEEGALGMAERIRHEVEQIVVETDKGPLEVTLSCGVAIFPDDARDRETLIERADSALYHAKESGRNRVVCHRAYAAARDARRAG